MRRQLGSVCESRQFLSFATFSCRGCHERLLRVDRRVRAGDKSAKEFETGFPGHKPSQLTRLARPPSSPDCRDSQTDPFFLPCVGAEEPLHSVYQIGPGRLYHQVKMIGHQALGVHLPVAFRAGFTQRLEPQLTIGIAADNRLPAITAAHHVIDRSGVLDSDLAGHSQSSIDRRILCQS